MVYFLWLENSLAAIVSAAPESPDFAFAMQFVGAFGALQTREPSHAAHVPGHRTAAPKSLHAAFLDVTYHGTPCRNCLF